eukprot:g17288.t1
MEGPFHCNTVPVRRCPDVNFRSDGRLIYTKKTYHQGHFLDISEIHRSYDTKGRRVGEPKRSAAREVLGGALDGSEPLKSGGRTTGSNAQVAQLARESHGPSCQSESFGAWWMLSHQQYESVLCCLTFADCASMLLHSVALSCLLITEATLDLPSCSDWDADWDACLPDDDKLLLQTGVRAWAATGVCDDVEGRQRSRRFVPGTFGFACLCGNAKPFITAPLLSSDTSPATEYGSIPRCSGEAVWEKEYAAPWMLVLNALGVVGYQIVSMIFVAYQVLFRRKFIMVCWHGKLETWQLWTCEYTKAYTRFFPLVAILISMSPLDLLLLDLASVRTGSGPDGGCVRYV